MQQQFESPYSLLTLSLPLCLFLTFPPQLESSTVSLGLPGKGRQSIVSDYQASSTINYLRLTKRVAVTITQAVKVTSAPHGWAKRSHTPNDHSAHHRECRKSANVNLVNRTLKFQCSHFTNNFAHSQSDETKRQMIILFVFVLYYFIKFSS